MSHSLCRGDIFYIDRLTPQYGREQRAGRPGVIVSCEENNRHCQTVEVVYLTTQPKKDLPTHVEVLSTGIRSIALCEQITTVDIDRLGDYVATCNAEEMFRIDVACLSSLGIRIPGLKDYLKTAEIKTCKVGGAVREEKPEPVMEASQPECNSAAEMMKMELGLYKKLYEDLLDRLTAPKVS